MVCGLIVNTELNDLRLINCLGKFKVSVERIPVVMSLKNWWGMAYTVCHAPTPIISKICTTATMELPYVVLSNLAE